MAAAYKGHRSDILGVLVVFFFFGKAQTVIDGPRYAASNAAHNLALLKQSLEDQLSQLTRLYRKRRQMLRNSRRRWMLGRCSCGGGEEVWQLWRSRRSCCVRAASDHEASVKAFPEELKV